MVEDRQYLDPSSTPRHNIVWTSLATHGHRAAERELSGHLLNYSQMLASSVGGCRCRYFLSEVSMLLFDGWLLICRMDGLYVS